MLLQGHCGKWLLLMLPAQEGVGAGEAQERQNAQAATAERLGLPASTYPAQWVLCGKK